MHDVARLHQFHYCARRLTRIRHFEHRLVFVVAEFFAQGFNFFYTLFLHCAQQLFFCHLYTDHQIFDDVVGFSRFGWHGLQGAL